MFAHRAIAAVSGVLFAAALSAGAASAENLAIVGTGDGVSMLRSVGEAFSRTNPDIKIAVPDSIGSSGGIKAVGTGQQQIGRIAREIRDNEKSYGLAYVPLAKIPVVFFARKGVNVASLTRQQVADIYAGKVSNWSEVGGPNLRVRVIRREDGDSSLSALQQQVPEFKAIEITSRSKTTLNNDENLAAVEAAEGARFLDVPSGIERRLKAAFKPFMLPWMGHGGGDGSAGRVCARAWLE